MSSGSGLVEGGGDTVGTRGDVKWCEGAKGEEGRIGQGWIGLHRGCVCAGAGRGDSGALDATGIGVEVRVQLLDLVYARVESRRKIERRIFQKSHLS